MQKKNIVYFNIFGYYIMLSIHYHHHHHESFPNLIDLHPVPFLMIKVSELPVALAVLAVLTVVVVAVVVAAAVVAVVAMAVDILKISFRNQKIILI